MVRRRARRDPEAIRLEVEAALAVYVGLRVRVDVHDGVVRLRGVAPAMNIVRAATKLAAAVEGVRRVENQVFVPEEYPVESSADAPLLPPTVDVSLERLEADGLVPPEDTAKLQERMGAEDTLQAVEDGDIYTPPTDPVVAPLDRELDNLHVVGGFATTAMDGPIMDGPQPPSERNSDDDMAEQVRVVLLRDAATTDLNVQVEVQDGVAWLRGRVPSLDDVDAVEEVARRVPQLVDVENELLVEGIE